MRGVVFLREGASLISPMPIMTSPPKKFNGTAQSTWLEQLGSIASIWKTLGVWGSTVSRSQNAIQMK